MTTVCSTAVCGTGGWNGPLPGDPDNSSILTATAEFGGIQLSWTLPSTNAHAVAYTNIYRSIGDDFATAIPFTAISGTGYFDFQAAKVIRQYFYWIQHVSVNGTVLEPIGPASATAMPQIDQVIAALTGRIESSALATALRERIDVITDLENGLTQINTKTATDNAVFAQELTALRSDLTGALAYIDSQQTISINERQALVTSLNTQLAQFGDGMYAAIQDEATTRADETGDLFAQKTLKIDLAGNVSGYGLSARVDPTGQFTSDFQVRADTFSIAPPSMSSNTAPTNPYRGMVWVDTSVTPSITKWFNTSTGAWQTTPVKGAVPFIVKTTPETIDGYTAPAGVYIDSAYITRLSTNQIDTRGLIVRDLNGAPVIQMGTAIDWSKLGGSAPNLSGLGYTGALDATRNVFRGDWATAVAYKVGDVVAVGGSTWTARVDHTSANGTNNPPALPATSNTWWLLLAAKGDTGAATYTWIKYADSPTAGMSDFPDGKAYLGVAYNKPTATESTNYADYSWALIKGEQGIQGPTGANGQTTYTWIKYADDASGTGLSDSPTGKKYIGIAPNKTTATESATPADYTWALIQGPQGIQGVQGIQGPTGADGVTYYTWVKYADSPTTGMSDFPDGKAYLGVAYNKTTATESVNYADYAWALIKGDQGVAGPAGANGQTTYTWIKYADTATGTGMSDSPVGKTYVGLAVNKTTATESTVATDYTWALIQGPQGIQGIQGPTGPAGANAVAAILSNEAHVFSAATDGTVATYAGSGTDIRVYEGATELAYDGVGTANGTWKVTPVASGITVGTLTDSGTYLTVGTHTGMAAATNVATITYTVTGKTAAGVAFSVTKVQTFGKSKAGAAGATGAAGSNATAYWLVTSAPAVQKSVGGIYTPSVVTYSSMSATGTAAPAAYAGRFIIATSTDGTTYTDQYTSAANEASKAFTIPANIKTVRVRAYLAGGTTTLLDELITTVVSDGATGATGRYGLNFAEAKSMFTDPTFQVGSNSVGLYNNAGGGTVTHTREARQTDSPFTDSGFNMKISNTGAASPGIGGFIHPFNGRASAVFVQRIVAKIPVGYTIEQATNAIGDGATNEWITPQAGTGKFEEYILVRRCGATGTFSGSGHIYLNGAAGSAGAPVNWYVAYAATYDFTAVGFGAITAVLSNEAHTVPTDSAGNNGNFTGCTTTMAVYSGATDDSANWTVAATPIAGVTGSLAGKTYTVTAMTVDTGYVDLVASRAGYASVTKRFTLTKSKAGATGAAGAVGAQGPSVLVTPDRVTTFTATDGTLDASQANIVFTAAVSGVTSPTYTWSFSGFQTAPTNSGTASQTITAAQFGTAKSAIVTCTVSGAYTDKVTVVRLEKSTAAAGATVGAPAGTSVGGVLAETVASKANGALQKAGDAITGPVTFATNGGILAATDADNGVFMGPNGLVGKKAGATTFAIDTAGNASFGGTLNANAINAVNTINIAGNAVTTPAAAEYLSPNAPNNGTNFTSAGTVCSTPSADFKSGSVMVSLTMRVKVPSFSMNSFYVELYRSGVLIKSYSVYNGSDVPQSHAFAFVDSPGSGLKNYAMKIYSLGDVSGSNGASVFNASIQVLGVFK